MAKFVPGLGTMAAPIAGQTGMKYRIFPRLRPSGALFWAATLTVIGRFFGDVLRVHHEALSWMGHFAGALFLLAVIGLLGYRVWKQQAFLQQVRTSRLDPVELKRMLDGGQSPYIIDLRHPLRLPAGPRCYRARSGYSLETMMLRSEEVPRDRDVILYCTCPSEATAAKMAMKLRQNGIYRVRPLLGGFDQWKKLGYPLEAYEEQPASIA